MQTEILIKKIEQLPPRRIAEIEDFVDFLIQREERDLVKSAAKLSENAFAKAWDNDEDSVYDNL